jgi:hypothetical protein
MAEQEVLKLEALLAVTNLIHQNFAKILAVRQGLLHYLVEP